MNFQPSATPGQMSDGKEVPLTEPVNTTRAPETPFGTTSNMAGPALSAEAADRERKKQRLRELQDRHDYVATIANHMEKHYQTTQPPPWLDLRVVAQQLMRSCRRGSKHAAWRSARDSTLAIGPWKRGHGSWTEARQESRMPYIGSRSEIKATEFIEGKEACVPRCIWQGLKEIGLQFLLENELPGREEDIPDFWKGAKLDDPEWVSGRPSVFHWDCWECHHSKAASVHDSRS